MLQCFPYVSFDIFLKCKIEHVDGKIASNVKFSFSFFVFFCMSQSQENKMSFQKSYIFKKMTFWESRSFQLVIGFFQISSKNTSEIF